MGSGRSAPVQQPVQGGAYPKPAAQQTAYGGPPAYSANPAPYGMQQQQQVGQAGQMAYSQPQGQPQQTAYVQTHGQPQHQMAYVQTQGQPQQQVAYVQMQGQPRQQIVYVQTQGQPQQRLPTQPVATQMQMGPGPQQQQGQRTGGMQAQPPQQPQAVAAASKGGATAPAEVRVYASKCDSSDSDSDGEGENKVSQKRVAKFVDLDQKIRELQQSNVEATYKLKQQDLERLSASVTALQKRVNDANAKCAKEKTDVDQATRANGNASALYALGLGTINQEQQEYLAALTELDMAKRELEREQQALDALKAEIGPLKDAYMRILDLQDDQENILGKIFKGAYGSLKENQLEKEADFHWERQQRIKLASTRWLTSRAYIMEACNQLSAGCKKWTEIPMMPVSNGMQMSRNELIAAVTGSNDMEKGSIATQSRNYFIAAIQNCNSAQSCLPTIRFPYCHASDLATLDLAVKNVYLDIRQPERHHQVYNNCYLAMYNRAVGLLRWFDQVIAGTIEKDYKEATALVARKMRELRNERVRLMIDVLQRQGYTGQLPSLLPDEPQQAPPIATMATAPSVLPVQVQDENGKPLATPTADLSSQPPQLPAPSSETGAAEAAAAPAPAVAPEGLASAPPPMLGGTDTGQAPGGGPIPLDKLAPPPSKEDLFGDVQELFSKHAEEMKELERINDVNKARQEQDLADKLAQRRSRKMRQQEQVQAAASTAPAV